MKLYKHTLFASSLVAASSLLAQSAYVDFGSSNVAGTYGGNYFNVFSGGSFENLLDASDGVTDTGFNLFSTTPAISNNGTSPDFIFSSTTGSTFTPNAFSFDDIVSDALNLGAADAARNVVISGLNTNATYNLVLLGTRESTQTRVTTYTVTGNSVLVDTLTTSGSGIGGGGQNFNTGALSFLNITPDALGQITIEYDGTTGDFGYMNALSITQVPEPSSFALIAGSLALGWIMIRRRK